MTDEVLPGRNNVAAVLKGEARLPVLVLICHMDTVVLGKGWTEDPLGAEVKKQRIYGRGASDMKAGLACALWVFRKTALQVEQNGMRLRQTFPGYTDTAVIAGTLHNRNCLSYGPGSLKLAHKPDEYVKVEDIQ